MILSFIDTIGNVLEAHYNVVCYLGSLIYNTHVATTNLLSAVGQGIRDFYYVVGSILTDTFLLLLMILKHMVLGVRIIWTGLFITLNFVETTILWILSLAAYVAGLLYVAVTSTWNGLLLILDSIKGLLMGIDGHVLWCLRHISDLWLYCATWLFTYLGVALYHLLLFPYYVITYITEVTAGLILAIYRLLRDGASSAPTMMGSLFEHFLTVGMRILQSAQYIAEVYKTAIYQNVLYVGVIAEYMNEINTQIYLSGSGLIFMDQITLQNAFLTILLLPLQLVSLVIHHVTLTSKDLICLTFGRPTLHPNYPRWFLRDIYCCIMEVVLAGALSLFHNWKEIMMLATIGITVFVSVRMRSIRPPVNQGEPAAGDNINLADESGSNADESDDEETSLRLSQSNRRVTRSRSRSATPDLNVPGAETRYIHKLKRLLLDEKDRRLCVVCQENSRTILLLPCKHVCVCTLCVQQLLRTRRPLCPLCRVTIRQHMGVFI